MIFYQLKIELFNSKNQPIQYIPNNIFESISNVDKRIITKNKKSDNSNNIIKQKEFLSSENQNIDFRLGPINIEWIDMENKIIDENNKENLTNNIDVGHNNTIKNNGQDNSSTLLKNNENNSNSLSNEHLLSNENLNTLNNNNYNNSNYNTTTTTTTTINNNDINNNHNHNNNNNENTPVNNNLLYSQSQTQTQTYNYKNNQNNDNNNNNNNNTISKNKINNNPLLKNSSLPNNNAYELERQQYIKINEKRIKKHGFIPVSGGFIPYSSINTNFEIGILHLYRGITNNNSRNDNSSSSMDNYFIEDNENSPDSANSSNQPSLNKDLELSSSNLSTNEDTIKKCKIVCVLAVPSYMSTIDFLNFVGPIRKYVSHFRIINDTLPNRFMVLMMFRKAKHAYDFVSHYNGIQFNSLEPETCHAVFIEKIEFQAKDLPSHLILFPDNPIAIEDLKKMEEERGKQKQEQPSKNTEDGNKNENGNENGNIIEPLESETLNVSETNGSATSSKDITSKKESINSNSDSKNKGIIISTTSNQNILSKTNQAELPICPVCLERMDSSVTGLLTILCQHTFHCHCLSKWRGSTCPVCRYSQKSFLGNDQQNECSSCQSTENLWICLICGNIGCGRYQQAHAYQHFIETNHLYSLEIETQRVWDYAGDGYVHRLIQNKVDGKLVELPSPGPVNEDGQPSLLLQQQQQQQQNQQQLASNMLTQINNDKINFLNTEYNDLLTTQLESQKFYFENQMEDMKKVFNVQIQNLNEYYENINMEKSKEINELNEKLKQESNQNQNLEKEKNQYYTLMNDLLKEKKTMEKKIERNENLEKEYQEEKLLTKVLLENQNKLKNLVDEKDKEINDLREQVRDLMFYLDAKSKVENCEIKDEIQNGTIILSEEASSSNGKKKKKPKNKKKK